LKNTIEDYYKKLDKGGDIKGNLDESDEDKSALSATSTQTLPDEKDDGEETSGDDAGSQETTDEAMTAAEIIASFNNRKKSTQELQQKIADTVKSVEIEELYNGKVAGEATMNDGSKRKFEFTVPEDEIKAMLKTLEKKFPNEYLGDMDAAVACVRLRIDPNDKLDWFAGPAKTSLDKWILQKEIEDEESFLGHPVTSVDDDDDEDDSSKDEYDDEHEADDPDEDKDFWTRQMGGFVNDYGDEDDDSFKSWDDGMNPNS